MHQTKEEPEEGGDEFQEANNQSASDLQQSQPVFPASISSGVVLLIDLLNDNELNSNHQSVSVLAKY